MYVAKQRRSDEKCCCPLRDRRGYTSLISKEQCVFLTPHVVTQHGHVFINVCAFTYTCTAFIDICACTVCRCVIHILNTHRDVWREIETFGIVFIKTLNRVIVVISGKRFGFLYFYRDVLLK